MATFVWPGSFSSAAKPRPSAGRTLSTSKKLALTSAPSRRTGRPRPVRCIPPSSKTASESKDCAAFCVSRKFCGE